MEKNRMMQKIKMKLSIIVYLDDRRLEGLPAGPVYGYFDVIVIGIALSTCRGRIEGVGKVIDVIVISATLSTCEGD